MLSRSTDTTPLPAQHAQQTPGVQTKATDALSGRADFSFLAAKAKFEAFALAGPGTAARELTDRMRAGEPVDRAIAGVQVRFGATVNDEDRRALQEFQAKKLLAVAPLDLEVGTPPSSFVRPGTVSPHPEAYTPSTEQQPPMNQTQLKAVSEFKALLNEALGESAAAMGAMEASGLQHTSEYQVVASRYEELAHAAAPSPAAIGLAQSRELAAHQIAGETSPALQDHDQRLLHLVNPAAPRPSINGRFAGFENPQGMPLERTVAVQVALKADPKAPEAPGLMAWAQRPPKDLGLNDQALHAMWLEQRARQDAHKASMDAPISAAPAPAKPLAERMAEHPASGPVSDPWGLPSRDIDLPMNSDTPPRQGNGPPTGGDGLAVGDARPGRANGLGKAWEAPMTPEAHSAAAVQKQIKEVEARAEKEMNRQRLLLALSLGGNILASGAEAAVAIGTSPLHGNAAQSINSVASGMRDSINRTGEYLEQKQRVISKADTDIKGFLAQHAKEQRDVAESWNEKMSNQMEHLKAIEIPVEDLDRAERTVSLAVLRDGEFVAAYERTRDRDAAAIHLAAADEMRMSPDSRLQKIGQDAAESILSGEAPKTWLETEARVQARLRDGSSALEAYKGYRAGVEDRHHEWAVQVESHERISAAAHSPEKMNRLIRLTQDSALAGRLVDRAEKVGGDARSVGEVLEMALQNKARVERSVSASWREFTAQAPVHAQSVVTGGISAEAQLASLYGRRGGEDLSPDRETVYALQRNYLNVAPAERAEQGIPEGWGGPSNLGRKVGIGLTQNGSVQALLIGHGPQGRLQEAAVHGFLSERTGVRDSQLREFGLNDSEIHDFRAAQAADPQLQFHALITRSEAKGDPTNPHDLASKLSLKYNQSLERAIRADADAQIERDSWRFAAIKSGVRDPFLLNSFHAKAPEHTRNDSDAYKARFGSEYSVRAEALIAREKISRSLARPMAAQILQSRDISGLQQVVERNQGGHFAYPPSPASLDPSPAKGLHSDFRRLMTAADHQFTGLYGELTQARTRGISLTKDPHLLEKAGDRSRSLGAVLDSPVRQSELGGRPAGGNEYQIFVDAMRARGGRL